MNRKPIGGSISSSSYPLHLIIFSVGIIILFLGLLYEFISILNLHHVLQEKEIEIHQLSSELLHQTQQESLLELDIKNLQEKVSLMNQLREKRNQKITEYLPYDLRDVLYLSKLQTNSEVMQEFKKKWQVTSPLYETCGVVQSILPPTLHPSFGASNPCKIAIVSSWFPRPCGIATHSHMLYDGITDVCPTNSQIDILAIRNTNESPSIFPSEVKRSFSKSSLEEYNEIANYINQNKYHAVIIGYEFGLFEDEYLLCLLRHIQTSYTQVITILHTLADNLPYQKQALTQQVALLSHRIIVMTETMKRTIDSLHRIPYSHVEVIPHGVPDFPSDLQLSKSKSLKILVSNGLIHQGKGLEYTIDAIPSLLSSHPNLKYYILGTPHPTGTGTREYYMSLKQKVTDLSLQTVVFFNESFFPDQELWTILSSANIYINSYTDEVASVSGTLIMAMGLGIPCLSTPYPFAKEMFQDHRGGILVPFRDSKAITRGLKYLLDDDERATRIGLRGKEMTMNWKDVAKKYLELIYS